MALLYSKTQVVLSLQDLKALFWRHRKVILRSACIGAVLLFLVALRKAPSYEVSSVFKVSSSAQEEFSGGAGRMLSLLVSPEEGSQDAVALMSSRPLMEEVVKRLYLQMDVQAVGGPSFWARSAHNLMLEWLSWRKLWSRPRGGVVSGSIVIPEYEIASLSPVWVRPSALHFQGHFPLHLTLEFSDEERFTVIDGKKRTSGRLGEPFEGGSYNFTLEKVAGPLAGKSFQITLFPLADVAMTLSKDVRIMAQKKNLLQMSYQHTDPHLASCVLNAVMQGYKDYLKEMNYFKAKEQIAYLEERQDRSTERLEALVRQYTEFLKEDVHAGGFIHLDAEVEFLARTQESYKRRLQEIQLEKYFLEGSQEPSDLPEARLARLPLNPILTSLTENLTALRHEYASLEKAYVPSKEQKIRSQDTQEFAHIDLKTLQALYVTTTAALSESEASLRQFEELVLQTQQSDFEISALSCLLKDPIADKVIDSVATAQVRLQDEANLSQKEKEKLLEEVERSRRFITLHIQEMHRLESLRRGVFIEKLGSLNATKRDLLRQEIVLAEEKLRQHLSSSQEALGYEQNLIVQEAKNLQQQMAHLPEKWLNESLIDLRTKMNAKMIEEISRLVEAKNIAQNLERIDSFPVEHALPPKIPSPPHLVLSLLVGGLLGALGSYSTYLVRGLKKGVPVSRALLELYGQEVVDRKKLFSSESRESQETFRLLAQHLLPKNRKLKILGALVPQGQDYTPRLLLLLKRQKLSCCAIRFVPQRPELVACWQGYFEEEGPLPPCEMGPIVPQYVIADEPLQTTEWLQSGRFHALLEQCQKDYDLVVVIAEGSLAHSIGRAILECTEALVGCVENETLHDLAPFILKKEQDTSFPIVYIS